MQKSGTSLMNRMLMQQSFINNPFLPEGKFFWGDNPPFSPVDRPCGVLYQKHLGNHGHYLDESDFDLRDRGLLLSRIREASIDEPILMNKNPYNSVRIRWLKKVFPDCKIVAMYRDPIANVYSLLKKYETQNDGLGPEDGWWGIKPKNWKDIASDDKLIQCSKQWSAVNSEIINNINNIDMLLNYESLCKNANLIVSKITSLCDIDKPLSKLPICHNLNDEYLKGSRLLSKNREFRRNQGFDLNHLNEKIEFPPFSSKQINKVKSLCTNIWQKLLS